jgi:hypothetical protein
VAPGVGKATDIVVLNAKKLEPVSEERIKKLDEVRAKYLKGKPGQTELEVI